MNDYIVRKSELYMRARQALARVQKYYDGGKWEWQSSYGPRGSVDISDRWSHCEEWDWQRWRWNTPEAEKTTRDEAAENEDDAEQRSEAGRQSEGGRPSWRASQRGWEDYHDYRSWSRYPTDDAAWQYDTPELLPDFLQGWYLLTDAGLDAQERNMVQRAVNGDFSLARVAQELRAQWPEEDLKRKDQHGRQSCFWHDDMETIDETADADTMAMWTAADLRDEGMNDEGIALVAEAAEEMEGALAAWSRPDALCGRPVPGSTR